MLVMFLSFLSFSVKKVEKDKDNDYKVIKVQGAIINKKSGKSLAQGDVFKENTPLTFQTEDAKATVINAEKGRFVLTKNAKGGNLIPAINNIASRSGAILNLIDLQNYFQGKLCVIDELKTKISGSDFKMDNASFFYIEYKFKGETIAKKLDFINDTLIIKKSNLYKVDGNPIEKPDNEDVTLYYKNGKESKTIKVADFTMLFPEAKELELEVKIILDELKDKTTDKKIEEVGSYLNEFYGKTNKTNITTYLRDYFGVK